MKKFSFFITIFAAILTGIAIVTACSDDDESGIVGTWISSHDYYSSGYYSSGHEDLYLMFCSDGTLYEFETCSSHGYHVDKFEYNYNGHTGKLTITDILEDYTYSRNVEISGNKLYIYRGSGYQETYKRASSPLSKSKLERYWRGDSGSGKY